MQAAWGRIAARWAALVIAVSLNATAASAADWAVAQMSGQVTISVAGAQPVALRRDAVLPAGGVLRTGGASRALLIRNAETIAVGPNAAIAVPAGGNNPEFTTVLQNGGLVTFNVDKRNVQHFSVETPYLAAVVKGTEFSVEVTPTGATVRVTHGVVEVTALRNGYVSLLTAGQGVQVSADGSLAFAGVAQPMVTQSTPRAPLVGLTFGPLAPALPLLNGFGDTSAGLQLGRGASVNAGIGGSGLAVNVDAAGLNGLVSGLAGASSAASNGAATGNTSGAAVDIVAGPVGASAGEGGVQVNVGPLHLGIGH